MNSLPADSNTLPATTPPANSPPANTPPTGASPTKAQTHTESDTRPDRSLAADERRTMVPVDAFQANFLNLPDAKLMMNISRKVSALVFKVTEAQDKSSGHEAIPALFNKISEMLAASRKTNYKSNIHFWASPRQAPRHHPCGNLDNPDFLAMLGGIYNRHPDAKPVWHFLISIGEWKSGNTITDHELLQTGAYAGSFNQARPDNPSGLVFSACRGCYVIGYSDPSIWTTSEPISWDNLTPLMAYIHSLCEPRLNLKDTTIALANPSIPGSPQWKITDGTFNIDDTFEIIHVGRPHSSMTTIFRRVGPSQHLSPLIVKDSWVNNISRTPELALYQSLTAEGDAPGWVKIRPPSKVAEVGRLQTEEQYGVQRRKDRIVMENTGLGFDQCARLSDAIAAAYDVLEADRWAITKRRILHRDISPANILVHPTVPSDPRDGAHFIRGVLNLDVQVSSALLLDLDCGTTLPLKHCSLDEIAGLSKEHTQELRALSGTPMYIARGPSKRFYEDVGYSFPTLPTLDAAISEMYTNTYQDDSLRTACGLVGTVNHDYHSSRPEAERVVQRPWHDAESIMFTLLLFLLRCSPEGSSEESKDHLKHMQSMYDWLRYDEIGAVTDNRDNLLMAKQNKWKLFLHKDLHHLAQPLSKICEAVYPDYEFLQPISDAINVEVVLHEVLQRILLNLYYEITTTSPELDVTFSKNLRPLQVLQKQVFLPVTEAKSVYAPSKTYVSGSGSAYAFPPAKAGTSAIHTSGKRQRERDDSGERKPPAKRRKQQASPMNPGARQSRRLRNLPAEEDSAILQPVATDEAAQHNIDRYDAPEVEPVVMDAPQHDMDDMDDMEDRSDSPPRLTTEQKGKAPLRGQ